MHEGNLRRLLADKRVKLLIESAQGDYALEYYTVRFLGDKPHQPTLTPAYRLLDLNRGSTVRNPWDESDLERQPRILGQLLRGSGYKISKVAYGWRSQCERCMHLLEGEIWEPVPAKCGQCGARMNSDQVSEKAGS